eukprot:10202071-Alexandrium_andersonii.AAC.1
MSGNPGPWRGGQRSTTGSLANGSQTKSSPSSAGNRPQARQAPARGLPLEARQPQASRQHAEEQR